MGREYRVVSDDDFAVTEGLGDWRALDSRAYARFETKSFATGLALVNEIGRLAEEADHHPDVNLRYSVLEVRLSTHATDSLTDADMDLAQRISAAARELGVAAAPDETVAW